MGDELHEVSPPGWAGTVKAMLRHHKGIKNPYALAWSMKGKGAKPHYKVPGDEKSTGPGEPEKKKKYKGEKRRKTFSEWLEWRSR